MSVAEVSELLNSKSGFQGLTGHADLREVLKAKSAGDQKADVALQVSLSHNDARHACEKLPQGARPYAASNVH